MIGYIIGIIVTFSIGAMFGITIMCCFVVSSDSDKRKRIMTEVRT